MLMLVPQPDRPRRVRSNFRAVKLKTFFLEILALVQTGLVRDAGVTMDIDQVLFQRKPINRFGHRAAYLDVLVSRKNSEADRRRLATGTA
jgi:hypothetical protein